MPATVVAPATPPTAEPPGAPVPAGVAPEVAGTRGAGFRDRGRLRRRMRYLRSVREIAFRDLGGLVFDLHRFRRRNDELVLRKLAALDAVDRELRAIERVLDERRDIIELREPGVAACPRCGALHGSDARFCPQCGTQFSGPLAMGEVGGPAAPPPVSAPVAEAPTQSAGTPVSGALAGNPPPPPPPPVAEPAAAADDDQATRTMPAVTSGEAPRDRPGS
ncbi:MAG TPA: zinc ribbon domain-containing protein [Solirubrobacteraceae bacterium]